MDPILYQTCVQKIENLEGKLDALDQKSLDKVSEVYDKNQKKKLRNDYNKIVNIETYIFNKKITKIFKPLTRDIYASIYMTIYLMFCINIILNCRKF